jgi:hypothetical protein
MIIYIVIQYETGVGVRKDRTAATPPLGQGEEGN